jgi:anti-sigma factor RsiW
LDGELGAAAAAALASHIADCDACAELRGTLGALSADLRAHAARHAAPTHLRHAVQAQSDPKMPWHEGLSHLLSRREAGWFGAGLALAASLSFLVWLPLHGIQDQYSPAEEIVSAHIRALQPGHLLDVPSTDKHTVKPWFDGRLDFAPPVRDFAAQGYPLIGGRLDYVAGREVAALVYRRDKHLIDLFIWPGSQPASFTTVQGYNLYAWSADGMNFRAVSDLESTQLNRFKNLLKGQG